MSGVRGLRRLMVLPLLWLIRGYQLLISPLTPPSCRFYPSCSAYAVTALTRHGLLKGGWLAMKRIGRCHPWTDGGVDHVPPLPGEAPDDHRLPEDRVARAVSDPDHLPTLRRPRAAS